MNRIKHVFAQKLTRNALWMIASKIYQVGVNLVVSLLMARYLGPANYGLVSYAASLTAMFTSLCTLGINSILVNELLKSREPGTLLGSAIGMRLVSSLLSVITLTALAWALNPDEPLTVAVVALYSTTLIAQCFDSLRSWYQANLASKISAVASAIGYTAAAVYRIFLLITGKTVIWFAAAHVVEFTLVAVLLLAAYRTRDPRGEPLRFSPATGRYLLKNSYHFILSGLMVALYGQMDRVMLKALLDETSVGLYSAASSVNAMWPFVLSAIIDSARPVILEKSAADPVLFEKYLVRLYGAVIYISFAAAACICLLSRLIILILYGQAYMGARAALCIISLGTAFSYLGVARSVWMVPLGKQKYEKYIAFSGAVCNLLLNSWMIPRWGVEGAAAATVATQFLTNFVVGFFFREIRPNNRLILRSLLFWRYL